MALWKTPRAIQAVRCHSARAECDVVHRSSTHVSVDKLWLNEDVDAVTQSSRVRDKPNAIAFLTSPREPHLLEYLCGQFETRFTESDSIESQGGRIWANGDGGRGATFHFTLPAAPAETNPPVDVA